MSLIPTSEPLSDSSLESTPISASSQFPMPLLPLEDHYLLCIFKPPLDGPLYLTPIFSIVINGKQDERSKDERKTAFDTAIYHPIVSQLVRHIDIVHDHQVSDNDSVKNPYKHKDLPLLFIRCTNLENAKFMGFRPSILNPSMYSQLRQSFIVSSLTGLDIIRFRGRNISELLGFLSLFPHLQCINDFTGCHFDNLEPLVDSTQDDAFIESDGQEPIDSVEQIDLKPLHKMWFLQFRGYTESDVAFINLGNTFFPQLEELYYGYRTGSQELNRLLRGLKDSLKSFHLHSGPFESLDVDTSGDKIILPPSLSSFSFPLYPCRAFKPTVPIAGPGFYARTLKSYSTESSHGLETVKMILFFQDEAMLHSSQGFGDLATIAQSLVELDDVLSSDDLGVMCLTVEVSGRSENHESRQQLKHSLEGALPNVYRRFFRHEGGARGYIGKFSWNN